MGEASLASELAGLRARRFDEEEGAAIEERVQERVAEERAGFALELKEARGAERELQRTVTSQANEIQSAMERLGETLHDQV